MAFESALAKGNIPAQTACPFSIFCFVKAKGDCCHKGVHHPVEFSCATARGFDIINKYKADAISLTI